MFDFVVFRRTDLDFIDAGLLAETLLFYQKVHIVLDQGSLQELTKIIGLEQLVDLLDRPNITASFQRNMTAVIQTSGLILYNYTIFSATPPTAKRKQMTDRSYVQYLVERQTGNTKVARRLSVKLCDKLAFSPLPESGNGIDDILGAAAGDIRDEIYIRDAIVRAMSITAPEIELPANWRFSVQFVGSHQGGQPQFAVDTNLNFDALNEKFHQRVPPSFASLSPAYLLTFICSARDAQYISSKHMSELIIDPVTSEIMRCRDI